MKNEIVYVVAGNRLVKGIEMAGSNQHKLRVFSRETGEISVKASRRITTLRCGGAR
jgi:hypothetical protein